MYYFCLMTIGERIKGLRLSKGLSKRGLAREANLSGGKQHIYKLEKGECLPSVSTINKIAAALGIHPSELLKL